MENLDKKFSGCINPDAVRSRYLELLKTGEYNLSALNEALSVKLAGMSGGTFRAKSAGGDFDFKFLLDSEKEEKLRDLLTELVNLKMADVNISLLGSWVWIEGSNTRTYKEELKKLGCRFNGKRTKEAGHGVWNWSLTRRKRGFKSSRTRQELGIKFEEKKVA